MELSKLNYRSLITVLMLEINVLNSLFRDDEKYKQLLNELTRIDNEGNGMPYQKDLTTALNINRNQLMALMQKLYKDFNTKLCAASAYPNENTEIWLLVHSREDYWVIGVNHLKYLPRVGDHFTLNFVKGEFGGQHFKVDSIYHELENGTHSININIYDRWAAEGKALWQ